MRRRYRRDVYADRVRRVKESIPDAAIGVDVIVGFPHESRQRFDATVSFVADLPVSYLHVFTYSERAGTKAAAEVDGGIAQAVPRSERSRRNRVLSWLLPGASGLHAASTLGGKGIGRSDVRVHGQLYPGVGTYRRRVRGNSRDHTP
jgi:tRNA A37 methylthiotransferase MiaB